MDNAQTELTPTAVVAERDFSANADLVRGKVELGTEILVSPTGSADGRTVVTAVMVAPGTIVSSGDVLARISGQPLFLLTLDFPLYRTLHGGDEGDDVKALQQELKRLGFYVGQADGKYGPGTADAVKKLYAAHGLSAPGPDAEIQDAVEAAKAELESAQQDLTGGGSPSQGAEGPQGGSGSDSVAGRKAVERAKKTLVEAQAKAVTPLRSEHFWAIAQTEAKLVEIAAVGTELSGSEQPLAKLQVGDAQLIARVPASSIADFTVGAKGTAHRATDASQGWMVKVLAVGEFTTEPDEFSNRPGKDISFAFDITDGLEAGTEMFVELAKVRVPLKGLAVPLTGLREEGGATYVNVLVSPDRAGEHKRVPVVVLGTSDGFAHVESPELAVGDVLVVGD